MVDHGKVGLGCLVGCAVFLIIAIILFAEVAYTPGGAVWALLSALALLNLGLALRVPVKAPRKWAAVLAAVTAALAGMAFIASAVWASQPAVEDGAAGKPFFALVTAVIMGGIAFVNLRPPTASNSGDGKVASYVAEEAGAPLGGRDKCRLCCFGFCAFLLFFLVSLSSVHAILQAAEKPEFAADESTLFDVEGHKMFARCAGTGSPTVVFFHGLGGNSLDFTWIQRNLSQTMRTCSFDRAGYGQSSERGPLPRTSEQIAKEAKILLDQLDIDEFIAVGHSFAGFNMRMFNKANPGQMQGMVMIDTVNPNVTEACDPNETYPSPLFEFGLVAVEMGMLRIFELFGVLESFGNFGLLPEDVQPEYKTNVNKASYFRTRVDEFLVWGKSCSAVKNLAGEDKILDFPLHIIIPKKGIYSDDLVPSEEFIALSPNATYKLVEDNQVTHVEVLFAEKYARLTTISVLEIAQAIAP